MADAGRVPRDDLNRPVCRFSFASRALDWRLLIITVLCEIYGGSCGLLLVVAVDGCRRPSLLLIYGCTSIPLSTYTIVVANLSDLSMLPAVERLCDEKSAAPPGRARAEHPSLPRKERHPRDLKTVEPAMGQLRAACRRDGTLGPLRKRLMGHLIVATVGEARTIVTTAMDGREALAALIEFVDGDADARRLDRRHHPCPSPTE